MQMPNSTLNGFARKSKIITLFFANIHVFFLIMGSMSIFLLGSSEI